MISLRTICLSLAAIAGIYASAEYKIQPYAEPDDTATVDRSGWESVKGPLTFSWAPKDYHYRRHVAPAVTACADTTVSAWRGERIGLEALIGSTVTEGPVKIVLSDFRDAAGKKVSMPGSHASFMRYVVTTSWRACGYPDPNLPTFTVPDMIDLPESAVTLEPRTVRPVWCSVEVPRTLAPGNYTATLSLMPVKGKKPLATLGLSLVVNDHALPAPEDYAFYLDLWQQPYAISRYYNVEPWSDAHLKKLEPYTDMLARAGQKTITTVLFYEPWGEQSHDKFEPMVETVRRADGSWAFDYTVFDRYVQYMMDHGIDGNISCFTMVPWEMKFRYKDEPTGEYKFLEAKTDSPEYKELWTATLQSLASHLRSKGWFDKAMIVMDERGLPQMLDARRVAKEAVPDFKMSLAGSYHKELVDSLESYTLIKGDFFPADVMKRRHDQGFITLMYTCCATPAPSQFSNSEPADGAYLPVYATATGHDGYLHWSFSNWQDTPLTDTRFRMFAPGDTYFVYPDGRSSIRYERMLEGIQLSEKIRLLRAELEAARDFDGMMMLEQALEPLRSGAMNSWYPTSTVINDLTKAIEAISAR